jgi:hypothetical protein
MRSIERQFSLVADKPSNKYRSTLNVFAEAVYGRHYTVRMLRLWFHKLVDKDDYPKELERQVIADLVNKTNALRTVSK